MKRVIILNVNGNDYEVAVKPSQLLLGVLRDDLGLMGTKSGCEEGACGACTVIINGKAILSCLSLAVRCEGLPITTIEGISSPESLHPIQQSFMDNGAVQCGFCTPGIIMSAKALLDGNPHPDDEEIKAALAGNFCRCTGHIKTIEAVKKASRPDDKEMNNARKI